MYNHFGVTITHMGGLLLPPICSGAPPRAPPVPQRGATLPRETSDQKVPDFIYFHSSPPLHTVVTSACHQFIIGVV